MGINILNLLIFLSFQSSWMEIDKKTFQIEMTKTEKHFQLDNYGFTYEYVSYVGRETTSAHDRMRGIYKKKGKQVFTSIEEQITVQNEKYKVLVDNSAKEIIVTNAQSIGPSDLDKLIHQFTLDIALKIQKKSLPNGMQFRLEYPKEGEFADNILEFDSAYLLRKIVTNYNHKKELEQNGGKKIYDYPRVELLISDYKKKVELNPSETVENFIEIKNKRIELKPVYKNYRITDLTN